MTVALARRAALKADNGWFALVRSCSFPRAIVAKHALLPLYACCARGLLQLKNNSI